MDQSMDLYELKTAASGKERQRVVTWRLMLRGVCRFSLVLLAALHLGCQAATFTISGEEFDEATYGRAIGKQGSYYEEFATRKIAWRLHEKAQYDAAKEWLVKSVKFGDAQSAWYLIDSHYDDGCDLLSEILDTGPTNLKSEKVASLRERMAERYETRGQFDKAADQYASIAFGDNHLGDSRASKLLEIYKKHQAQVRFSQRVEDRVASLKYENEKRHKDFEARERESEARVQAAERQAEYDAKHPEEAAVRLKRESAAAKTQLLRIRLQDVEQRATRKFNESVRLESLASDYETGVAGQRMSWDQGNKRAAELRGDAARLLEASKALDEEARNLRMSLEQAE
jgi:hypothetical protein